MVKVVYTILAGSVVTLILAIVTKYATGVVQRPGVVAGVGPTGYLIATVVLLLICANIALLELLKKNK